jgi:hypothetical protein
MPTSGDPHLDCGRVNHFRVLRPLIEIQADIRPIGGSLRGCAETEITVRDGLHRRLRPQLAEFAATECPRGADGEGLAGLATLDPVRGMRVYASQADQGPGGWVARATAIGPIDSTSYEHTPAEAFLRRPIKRLH